MVNPLPTITATVSQSTICFGDNITLTGNGLGSGNSNYTWWANNNDWSTNTGASVTAIPTTSTTFHVTGEDVNGCIDSNTVSVIVNPLPTVSAGNDLALCFQNVDTTLVGSPLGGTWSGPGISSAGVFNPSQQE